MTTTGTTKIDHQGAPTATVAAVPVTSLRAAGRRKARKWAALGATLVLMLAAAVTFGEEPTRCREAYLASHFTEQQMSFEEFREFYADTTCAAE